MGVKIGLMAVGFAAMLGVLYWVYDSGGDAKEIANERRNVESGRRADKSDDALTNCDGLFDFWTQKCERAP